FHLGGDEASQLRFTSRRALRLADGPISRALAAWLVATAGVGHGGGARQPDADRRRRERELAGGRRRRRVGAVARPFRARPGGLGVGRRRAVRGRLAGVETLVAREPQRRPGV